MRIFSPSGLRFTPLTPGHFRILARAAKLYERRPGEKDWYSNVWWERVSASFHELRRISDVSEPRIPGSPAEERMAEYVASRLDELEIPNTTIPFRTIRGTATLYLVPFLGLLLSVGIALLYPLAGLITATVFALLALLEATNRPLLSRIFRLDQTRNVIGLVTHRPPPGLEDERALRQIVVVAPLDSPRLGILDRPLMQRYMRGLSLLAVFSILSIPALLAARLFLEEPRVLAATAVPALIIVVALILVMQRDIGGEQVPGRNSNASGIVAALSIAEELVRYPTQAVETLLLFTGASQSGSAGMTNFLSENAFNPETTYFISLQSVGRGPICFTRAEGPLLPLQSSPGLIHIAGDIALSNPDRLMRPIVHRGIPTEQYAALIRGYQAMTIMGHPDPAETTAPPEAVENDEVDPKEIDNARMLGLGIIRRLDDEARASLMPHFEENLGPDQE